MIVLILLFGVAPALQEKRYDTKKENIVKGDNKANQSSEANILN
jgi:hypothetical protein